MGEVVDFAEAGAANEALRVFRVQGDAMSPSYPPGSRALVNTVRPAFNGDGVYIIEENGCLVLTRLQGILEAGEPRVRISPDNPRYPVETTGLETVVIHGRVLGVIAAQ